MAENPTPRAEVASVRSSQPWLHQRGKEIQAFGTVRQFPIALTYETRTYACQRLHQLLADTQMLYALYKKHHWLMRGATFYQLHLSLDKHADEQLVLVDKIRRRRFLARGPTDATRSVERQHYLRRHHLHIRPLQGHHRGCPSVVTRPRGSEFMASFP